MAIYPAITAPTAAAINSIFKQVYSNNAFLVPQYIIIPVPNWVKYKRKCLLKDIV